MIKLLLKHNIFEMCIGYLFEQISVNFMVTNFNATIHHVGDYLKIMVTGFDRLITLTHCKIEKKEGDVVYISCYDFSEPLTLIVTNGRITDIKGPYNVICENFLK